MRSVLIVYGSRYGTTEEVVKKLTGDMESTGEMKIEMLNTKKYNEVLDLSRYDGIILASGIHQLQVKLRKMEKIV